MSFLKGPVLPTVLALGVTVASVGGAYALLSHDDAKTAPAPLRNAAWTVAGAQNAPAASDLAGVWVTSDLVVRASLDGLHAVKRADGTDAWDLPEPFAGGSVCALSAATDAGVGVFSYSKEPTGSGTCETAAGVDLATGKVLWTLADPSYQDVAVDGGMAVVRGSAVVAGLDPRSGVVKWKQEAKNTCAHGAGVFVADHGRVAVTQDCGTEKITVLDVKTGKQVDSVTPAYTKTQDPTGLSAQPLITGDSAVNTTVFSFGAAASRLPSAMTSLFPLVGNQVEARAAVSFGGGVFCAGGSAALCYTTAGKALVLRPFPGATAAHHDVIPVDSLAGDAARVIALGNGVQPRATLYRVNADGSYVAEATLSLPVSAFLGADGSAANPVFAFGDAKDLLLVAQRPGGQDAIVDVRLLAA